MNTWGPTYHIERVLELVPAMVADAAVYCSAAHWFDQELGLAIIEEFVRPNPSLDETFYELIELPFVYPREDKVWQYTGAARVFLRDQLLRRDGQFTQVSSFLAQYLRADRDEIEDEADWNARQLDWQIGYHLAPVDPDKAVERLFDLTERAARARRVTDIKVVAEVCDEQIDWLPSAEVAYLRGRYAYAREDWQAAEEYLSQVWEGGAKNPLMTANAGFLLGVMWRQKGKQAWMERAEDVLRQSLHMCESLLETDTRGAKELTAQVLNSLSATVIQLGGHRRPEVKAFLSRSLEIGEELQDLSHIGRVLNTQAVFLLHLGSHRDLIEAEKLLRSSLSIGEDLHRPMHIAKALNSLGQVLVCQGGRERLLAAEKRYRRSLKISEELRNQHSIAQVLQNLGTVLAMLGGKQREDEAEQLFRRCVQIWEELDNAEGRIRSLNSLGQLLVQLGREEEGKRILKQAREIEW